jgi:hypothetical protein
MEESLRKIIKKVILPKYPWITDFAVITTKNETINLYGVYYYTYDDLYDEKNRDKFDDVRSTTKTLYDVLGPSSSDKAVYVTFREDFAKR